MINRREAISILGNDIYIECCEGIDEPRAEALLMAVTALREQEKQNRPLTLEELSQIKKEPVWVSGHGWQIAHGVTDVYGPLRLIVGQRDTINIEDYGNSIVAYRCKPEEDA